MKIKQLEVELEVNTLLENHISREEFDRRTKHKLATKLAYEILSNIDKLPMEHTIERNEISNIITHKLKLQIAN